MTTAAENERLATLETKVSRIETDVTEIKADVKTLVTAHAARAAADAAVSAKEAQTGVWVRFLTERAIAILALGAAVYAILKG